jgi:hypothetical protein
MSQKPQTSSRLSQKRELQNPDTNGIDQMNAKQTKVAEGSDRFVQFGAQKVQFPGSELAEMRPSNDLLDVKDFEGLRSRLDAEGYLFLRSVIGRSAVMNARKYVLGDFEKKGDILDPSRPTEDGILRKECGMTCIPFMEGKNDITHSSQVLTGVLESSEMKEFFTNLFDEEIRTFDFKWLRVRAYLRFKSVACSFHW